MKIGFFGKANGNLLMAFLMLWVHRPCPNTKVAAELRYEFTLALKEKKCTTCIAYDHIDYKTSEDTILIPDILVVCGEIKKKFLDFASSIVVEILSPSTALKDRNTKYQIYEQEKVKYYVVVDIDTESVEIYQLINDKYSLQAQATNFQFELQADCSINVQFANIFRWVK